MSHRWTQAEVDAHNAKVAAQSGSDWSAVDILVLRELYQQPITLEEIAERLHRSRDAVAIKASKLGLVKTRDPEWSAEARRVVLQKLRDPQVAAAHAQKISDWIKTHGHPKGMLGKHHTDETKEAIRKIHLGKKVPRGRVLQGIKTKIANGTLLKARPHTTWKQGWHEVGGRRFYFRSSWELKYANHLEWLKRIGVVVAWDYEVKTFWFDGEKRGVTNYTPDFEVVLNSGVTEYHEVKGWMDAKSKTKLRRMKKYHPGVVVRVIDAAWFKSNRISV